MREQIGEDPMNELEELGKEDALRAEQKALVEDIQRLQRGHPSSQEKAEIQEKRSRLHVVAEDLSAIDNQRSVHQ